jgi:hypothetical protein
MLMAESQSHRGEAKAYHEVAKATPKYYFLLNKWIYGYNHHSNNIYLVTINVFNYKKLVKIENLK